MASGDTLANAAQAAVAAVARAEAAIAKNIAVKFCAYYFPDQADLSERPY